MTNFQPFEVVDRGSETQPQVVENLNKFALSDKGEPFECSVIPYYFNILLFLLLFTLF